MNFLSKFKLVLLLELRQVFTPVTAHNLGSTYYFFQGFITFLFTKKEYAYA